VRTLIERGPEEALKMRPWIAQYILKKGEPIREFGFEDSPDRFREGMLVAFLLLMLLFIFILVIGSFF
jgi:hypothetical protein